MNGDYESISLSEWVMLYPEEDQMRSVFFSLDRALKYLHEHHYCIESFDPTKIFILNHDNRYVQYEKFVPIPSDFNEEASIIQEDIFYSAFLQIAIYSGSLGYLTPQFLKENFKEFEQFLPKDDIPYYRGVIERGASVYYSDYVLEKKSRDLKQLAGQFDEEVDSSIIFHDDHAINDFIYHKISGTDHGAFISLLFIPVLGLFYLALFFLFSWCFSFFS